jgi:hypothetical protein
MKRTYTFVTAREVVQRNIDGVSISLPVFVAFSSIRRNASFASC